MSEQFNVRNLPDTIKSLSRSHGEGRIRNQSFSVSRKSKRVKIDMVDHRLLHMATISQKMAKSAESKLKNNVTPLTMLQRIDRKLNELEHKRLKLARQDRDTKAIVDLIFRCNYYRHCEIIRLAELTARREAKDIEAEKIMLPSNEVPVFERPIVPASLGRSYKVKRRVLTDKPSKRGVAKPGRVAIPKRSKPRKSKASVRKGAGSY